MGRHIRARSRRRDENPELADLWGKASARAKYLKPKSKKEKRHNARIDAARGAAERMSRFRSMPYQDYLQTPHWKARRKQAIKRVGGKCEQCGRERGLQVHHLNYSHPFAERKGDLKVLCYGCHSCEHPDKAIPMDEISIEFRAIIG